MPESSHIFDGNPVSTQDWSDDSGADVGSKVTKIVGRQGAGDKNGRKFPDF
jgi:hypothetical protein